MSIRTRVLLALFVPLVLSACATGPTFTAFEPVSPGKAQLYLGREFRQFGAGLTFDITVDGKPVGRLANAGFLAVDLTPGAHYIGAATTVGGGFLTFSEGQRHAAGTQIKVAEGDRAFVRVALEAKNQVTVTQWWWSVKEIKNPDEAAELLKGLRNSSDRH